MALKYSFDNLIDCLNVSRFHYELAVNIEVHPTEFEGRCIQRVSVDDSLEILNQLIYWLPAKLPDLGALTQALTQSPRMLIQEMDRYVERCQQLPSNG